MGKLFKNFQSKHKKGFTLIEVLVVVIIIGILATISVPTYNKIVRRSRVSDGLNTLDMLAGAQEKFFIEHGHYAQNIQDLNVPIRESRVEDPGNPFSDIVTANFTYTKEARENCIQAVASTGNYSLVKNYRQNGKTVCMGAGCADISDYVDALQTHGVNNAYASLCPEEEECTWSQNDCGSHHFWADRCRCKCLQSEYVSCVIIGGTFNYEDCSCSGTLPPTPVCDNPCEQEGQVVGEYTGENCNFGAVNASGKETINQGGNLSNKEKQKQKGEGKGRASDPTGEDPQTLKCGVIYQKATCNKGCWEFSTECRDKTEVCSAMPHYVLNPLTCECDKTCDPQTKPNCATTGERYVICDPCPTSPSILEQINQSAASHTSIKGRGGSDPKGSFTCFHCGYKEVNKPEAVCVNGEWQCDANPSGECQEVTGEIEPYQDCDGIGTAGSKCGKSTLDYVRCKQDIIGGIPEMLPQYSVTCELKEENECFDGQTTTEGCPLGQQKTCSGCKWSECESFDPCAGLANNLETLFVDNTQQCMKYETQCMQDPTTGEGYWDYDYTQANWAQSNYNCITGTTEYCYEGSTPKGAGNPCCDTSCVNDCQYDCTQTWGNAPEQIHQCKQQCIQNHGGLCQGGGGNPNIPNGYGCTAQLCPSGEIWHSSLCMCVPITGGGTGGTGGGGNGSGNTEPYGERVCEGCRWSECVPYGPCDNSPQLTGEGSRSCTTGSGSSQQCGRQTTTKQKCNESNGQWVWDYEGVPCDTSLPGFGPKPTTTPSDVTTSDGCLKKHQQYTCTYDGWVPSPTGDWLPNGQISGGLMGGITYYYNCSTDLTPNTSYYQSEWCEGCLKRKCPSGSVRNQNNGKCYTPAGNGDYGIFIRNNIIEWRDFWHGYYCITAEWTSENLIACKKDSDGKYFDDDVPTCDEFEMLGETGVATFNRCKVEKRDVVTGVNAASFYNLNNYCKTTSIPEKVATSIETLAPREFDKDFKYCGDWVIPPGAPYRQRYCGLYFDKEHPFEVTGSNTGAVTCIKRNSIILQ